MVILYYVIINVFREMNDEFRSADIYNFNIVLL